MLPFFSPFSSGSAASHLLPDRLLAGDPHRPAAPQADLRGELARRLTDPQACCADLRDLPGPALDALPASCRDGMELLAVAISENTVTAEVAAFSKDTTLKRSVKGMMADHLADEGRHAVFWINLVKLYWRGVDEDTRLQLGATLPLFLRAYLTNGIQADFDRRIIDALDMPEASRAQVRDDLVSAYPITKHHPIVANIVKFFRLSGLLDHAPTRAQLHAYL